jgi:hypothetical protein
MYGCLGTSHGLLCRSSSTTTPRAGLSSTTSPPPRVRVPRHVARLVTRLVAPLVVEYSTTRRLVVDYFASASRPSASARRAARHSARRATRLRQTSPQAGLSLTTSPPPLVRVPRHIAQLVTRLVAPLVVEYSALRKLIVDYFAYATRPSASAHRTARHVARRDARRRLLHLAQGRHRLLCLRRASRCLGTSRGSSRGLSRRSSSTTPPHAGSLSTTPPTPRIRVPRHVAWLISPLVVDYSASSRLVVDYFASAVRPGASALRSARHAARRTTRHRLLRLAKAHRRLLRLRRASECLGTSRGSSRRSSSTTPPRAGSSSTTSPPPCVRVPRHIAQLVTRHVARLIIDYSTSRKLVVEYFAYATRSGALARRAACRAARCATHR